tara:strand:- start:570 stop:959 length:390 start_codon:yes stop_codon:yes gene_type:complete
MAEKTPYHKIRLTVIVQKTQQWEVSIPTSELQLLLSKEDIYKEDTKMPVLDALQDKIDSIISSMQPTSGNEVQFISQKIEDIQHDFNMDIFLKEGSGDDESEDIPKLREEEELNAQFFGRSMKTLRGGE